MTHQLNTKILNVEAWTTQLVCEWLVGVRQNIDYIRLFASKQVTGKRLCIMDFSDLNDLLSTDADNSNLSDQIAIFKSIQNLIKIKHDLNQETLHSLIFNLKNRIVTIMNYIERVRKCSCSQKDCKSCASIKSDVIKNAPFLAAAHRKLISWLARLPFTRLKMFDGFRDEILGEMKNTFKIFRKRSNEQFFNQLYQSLVKLNDICNRMMDYCDRHSEDENGKISVAFSNCFLEKVTLKRREPDQLLGISFTCLVDGVFTVAEIMRETAADECQRLNVGDDIIAINDQVVIGWDSENLRLLLQYAFETTDVFSVLLRKMPRDTGNSLRQKSRRNQNMNSSRKLAAGLNSIVTVQRKHSFSDVFLNDQELLDNSSEDEEEEDDEEEESEEEEEEEDDEEEDEVDEDVDAADDDDPSQPNSYKDALANKSMHGSTSSPKLTASDSLTSPNSRKDACDTKNKSSMYILSISNLFSGKKVNSKRMNDKEFHPSATMSTGVVTRQDSAATNATNDDDNAFEKANMKAKIKGRKPTGRRRKLSFSNLFISANSRMNTKKMNDKEINVQPQSQSAKNSVERQLKPDDQKNFSPHSLDKKSPSFPKFNVASFQNLLLYNRSRSNSSDNSDADSHAGDHHMKKPKSNSTSKTSLDKGSGSSKLSKTELFKFFFSSKRSEMNNSKTFSGSTNLINLADSPNLMTANNDAATTTEASKPDQESSATSKDKDRENKSKKVSLSNSNSTESLNNRRLGQAGKNGGGSTLGLYDDPGSGKKPLLSKPPINKQRNYKPSVKPIVQGWLYKRKQVHTSSSTDLHTPALSLNTTGSLGRSGTNGSTTPNVLIRTQLKRHHKWHHYWCVLMKDYITFYKQADDKTPKDFLLLKNFNLTPSTHNNGFVIIDKMKLIEHEFYADTQAEFKDWYQNLFELRVKQTAANEMSASTSSLNETGNAGGQQAPSSTTTGAASASSSSSSSSIPPSISGSLARKNNLQMQLSTIIDSNDDLHNANAAASGKTGETSPSATGPALVTSLAQSNSYSGAIGGGNRNAMQSISSISPSALTSPSFTQLQQSYFNSSRESSPGISNNSKLASRDSSPGLNYNNYNMENDVGFTTSESDADLFSKVTNSENQDVVKDLIMKKNKPKNKACSLAASVATNSANISTSDLSSKKQMSCSPESTTSKKQFAYELLSPDAMLHHRCNSLPGSLQACVGSYLKMEGKRAAVRQESTTTTAGAADEEADSPQFQKSTTSYQLDQLSKPHAGTLPTSVTMPLQNVESVGVESYVQTAKPSAVPSPKQQVTFFSSGSSGGGGGQTVTTPPSSTKTHPPITFHHLNTSTRIYPANSTLNSETQSPPISATGPALTSPTLLAAKSSVVASSALQKPAMISTVAQLPHSLTAAPGLLAAAAAAAASQPPVAQSTRRISVQVGPNGIKQINNFNISSTQMGSGVGGQPTVLAKNPYVYKDAASSQQQQQQQQQQHPIYITSIANANLCKPSIQQQQQQQQQSPPTFYQSNARSTPGLVGQSGAQFTFQNSSGQAATTSHLQFQSAQPSSPNQHQQAPPGLYRTELTIMPTRSGAATAASKPSFNPAASSNSTPK